MSKELIVSATRHETRVAILEDDQLVEIFHQREKEYSLAGSIHKGRVTRVLPGMQSAFVDIGLERDAFLYVSDFFEDNDEYDKIVSGVEEKVLKLERGRRQTSAAPISLPTPVEPELAAMSWVLFRSALIGVGARRPPRRKSTEEAGYAVANGQRSAARGGLTHSANARRRTRPARSPTAPTGTGGLPESKFFLAA